MKVNGWKRRSGPEYLQKFEDVRSKARAEDNGPLDADKRMRHADFSHGDERAVFDTFKTVGGYYEPRVTLISKSEQSGATLERRIEMIECGGTMNVTESERVTSTRAGSSEPVPDSWSRKLRVSCDTGRIQEMTPRPEWDISTSDWFQTPQN